MTSPSPETHFSQHRRHWNDGTFSDVVSVRFPAEGFAFAEIDQRQRSVKLSEVAYLRSVKARARGVADPRVVVIARLERDRPASEIFPGLDLHTESGELLFSANSLITYTLRTLLARNWLRHAGDE